MKKKSPIPSVIYKDNYRHYTSVTIRSSRRVLPIYLQVESMKGNKELIFPILFRVSSTSLIVDSVQWNGNLKLARRRRQYLLSAQIHPALSRYSSCAWEDWVTDLYLSFLSEDNTSFEGDIFLIANRLFYYTTTSKKQCDDLKHLLITTLNHSHYDKSRTLEMA